MGKGDKRTKRGKIVNGSYGKKRPKSNNIVKQPPQEKVAAEPVEEPVMESVAEPIAEPVAEPANEE